MNPEFEIHLEASIFRNKWVWVPSLLLCDHKMMALGGTRPGTNYERGLEVKYEASFIKQRCS